MRISVRGKLGESTATGATFRTNDPSLPEGVIEAQVTTILSGASVEPSHVLFGAVARESEVRKSIDVRDHSLRARSIASVESSQPERFTVRLLPLNPSQSRADDVQRLIGQIEVTLKTAESCQVDGKIHVQFDDQEKLDPIRVIATIVDPVTITPAIFELPRSSQKGPLYSIECECRSTDGKPIALTIDRLSDDLDVAISDVEGEMAVKRVRVTCKPDRLSHFESGGEVKILLKAHGKDLDSSVCLLVRPRIPLKR